MIPEDYSLIQQKVSTMLRVFQRKVMTVPNALHRFKADIFQALAHPTRIAIVEQLREGELSAGTFIERLKLEQANASQHLAVLRTKNIVRGRREGNQVFYSIRDRALIEVLDILRRYFFDHLTEANDMIEELRLEQLEHSELPGGAIVKLSEEALKIGREAL